MQRGSGDGGGRRTGVRKVKAQITIVRGSPNRVTLMKFKGLLRYQKPHVTDNISIYAFAYNVQYADSLYCCLYLNIRYNIQCRITNFLHCVCRVSIKLSCTWIPAPSGDSPTEQRNKTLPHLFSICTAKNRRKSYFDFTSDLFIHICTKILTVLIQI